MPISAMFAHRVAQVGGEPAHLGFAAKVAAEQANSADVVLAQERGPAPRRAQCLGC
jgi:hypothetical protein